MAEVFLVRHGQAALGSDDYDRLTELGARQSRWLGAYLAERELRFDRVFTGNQRRHAETRDALAAAYGTLPPGAALPGLDEFDFGALCTAHAGPGALDGVLDGARRNIYRQLHGALQAWTRGELDGRVPETWDEFGVRVAAALARIEAAAAHGGRVLVICSGGPIARLLGLALALPDATTVGLNLQLMNSAFAQLYVSADGYQLCAFNRVPHLDREDRRSALSWV
jgi:broad specificity phosphatase PhoE